MHNYMQLTLNQSLTQMHKYMLLVIKLCNYTEDTIQY